MNLFPFPILAVFGWDDLIYYAIVVAATAASTYAGYSAQQQTAKQATECIVQSFEDEARRTGRTLRQTVSHFLETTP